MKRSAQRDRSMRRQLGQVMTPPELAARLVSDLPLGSSTRVLEPSFGAGAFLLPLIARMTDHMSYARAMRDCVFGVELDPALYERTLAAIEARWGPLPPGHHLHCGDYFRFEPEARFDLIVGNPPFGGTFDAGIEDALDGRFGSYGGHKLKKETYSFFVAKALDELAPGGRLRFICSDTFLTIKTMRGLRELLLDSGSVTVADLPGSFEETAQPMVVLDLLLGEPADGAALRGQWLPRAAMEQTQNLSWGLRAEHAPYFAGRALSDFVVATGGMTIGKNDLFVRAIQPGGTIEEPHEFEFFERPITVDGEVARARLNRLSPKLRARAAEQERRGDTRRAVRAPTRARPKRIQLPHPDYRPYNKARSARLYAEPSHVVYWRDDGDAVLTFKRDGPWYLHGVGGQPFFGREGITWQLVAPRINARYLPPGFILDSGAPCAFLRDGVPRRELFVVLGWLQTGLATRLLKEVINHTRNIQGKDIERLPYPHWVPADRLDDVAVLV
ncbi:MAG TPA: N-6 DNA methylase, partial [Thermoleophilaceae bacterium]|nr:N-6 DNA methylase [Thermoleophilaceae bacterium]